MVKARQELQPPVRRGIEEIPVGDLIPYDRNSRTHDAAQVAQLVASIREFGFTNPVLIDDAGTIIAGHGRVLAAKEVGLATVPCVRLSHLTAAQLRAYVIADNRLAENAGWDTDLLAAELDALRDDGFDLDLLGFAASELNDLIGTDRVPPPPGEDDDAGDESQAITFRLDPPSFKRVRRALDKARKANDLDDDGQALVVLCAAFLARK